MKTDFTIITRHLTLRMPKAQESGLLADVITTSPSLYQWLDWCSADFSKADAEEFITANQLNWIKDLSYGFAVYHNDDGSLIGMVAISEMHRSFNMASIGYWVADDCQRQGYGKEALNALIEFSFAKLKLTRLEIVCDPLNQPSHQLALTCGAVKEGLARNRYIFNGKPRDGLVFSVIPEDCVRS